MRYFIMGYTVTVKIKKDLQTKNSLFFENYNLTPLDMYNGLSQVYFIKPEGRMIHINSFIPHLNTNGLNSLVCKWGIIL